MTTFRSLLATLFTSTLLMTNSLSINTAHAADHPIGE